jgi:hypothetical protein
MYLEIYLRASIETRTCRNWRTRYGWRWRLNGARWRSAWGLVERFWAAHQQVRATQRWSQWVCLGVRLKVRNGVPRVEWYDLIFKGRRVRRRPTSRHFGRGGRLRYARGIVRGFARDWKLELFDELEPQFAGMRRKLKYLTAICHYLKLIELDEARAAAPQEPPTGETPAPGVAMSTARSMTSTRRSCLAVDARTRPEGCRERWRLTATFHAIARGGAAYPWQ